MKLVSYVMLIVTIIGLPSAVFAADDTVEKTDCKLAIGYDSMDELKADLLAAAKREVINELFGEMIVASTAVENFVVTSDQIRTSSIGFVRIEGNADFVNGKGFAEVCVTIHAYVTDEDRAKFNPEKLENKYCDADDDLTTAQLIAYVKDESIIQALIEYNPKLKGADKDSLLQLVQKVTYLESDFISDTQTYCATFEGYVVPVEVTAFFETNDITSTMLSNSGVCKLSQFEDEPEELQIDGTRVNEHNEYSSQYDAQKIIDHNTATYWSTTQGAILNNVLEFDFDEAVSINSISFYIPDRGGGYTQPRQVEIIFLDSANTVLRSEFLNLFGDQNEWEEHELSQPVCGVRIVKVNVTELTRSNASYLTIHEIKMHDWQLSAIE